MTDWTVLIAPVGVLAGAALTMTGNWLLESKKGTNARRAESRGRSVSECEDFLASIETELKNNEEFEDEHGVFPSEYYSEYGPANARKHLTRLELHAPASVHAAAVKLVEEFEGWIIGGSSSREEYSAARRAFVSEFRRTLA
jgi:hypothetical protein